MLSTVEVPAIPARAMKPHNLGLSARQIQILDLVCQGLYDREVAKRAKCSIGTVKTHIQRIFIKLNVTDRTAAAYKWGFCKGQCPSSDGQSSYGHADQKIMRQTVL